MDTFPQFPFQMLADSKPRRTLVQYLGDSSLWVPRAHKNSKDKTKHYERCGSGWLSFY